MFNFSLLASHAGSIPDPSGGDKEYYLYEELWTEYAKSSLANTFFYTAIALAVILIAVGIFVRFRKPQSLTPFLKTAATIALTFALTVIVVMVSLGFEKIAEKGYLQDSAMLLELVPPLVLAGVIALCAAACYIAGTFSDRAGKIAIYVSVAAVGAALVATVVCLGVYFARNVKDDGYYDSPEYGMLNQTALYIAAAAYVVATVAGALLLDMKNKKPFNSRCIALAGICVAASFALSYIKFFEMPQGGSITLASLLPLMLFAYVYGPRKGVLVGFVYGLLQAVQDPYIIHPAQFLLDYPIAFAVVGFAGAFAKIKALDKLPQIKFALGAVVGGALRFFAHVLSGVFAFGAYAVDSGATNFWAYSMGYNSFVFVDLILVVVAGAVLFSSKNFVKRVADFGTVKKAAATEEVRQPENV